MILEIFAEGLIIGVALAAPVGPIGVLCIRTTLLKGPLAGFVTGLGAATADAMYGFVAAFGLTMVSNFLLEAQSVLSLVGGGFLIWLGLRAWRAHPGSPDQPTATNSLGLFSGGLFSGYATTVGLTLANPATIFTFLAIFAGLGMAAGNRTVVEAAFLVAGVFLGSAAWWLFLAGLTSRLRARLDQGGMQWINRLSALLLAGFGGFILIGLAR